MALDLLTNLLTELGNALKMKLEPDAAHSCVLSFGEIKVQMEMSRDKRTFIIGCIICEMPSGRMREDLFKEALRYNGSPAPHVGTFAYSEKKDALIFFKALPSFGLNGDKVSTYLPPFVEKAKAWREEIKNGRIPQGIDENEARNSGAASAGGLFGLVR